MADDFQEKTEEATPKKLHDARKKGKVAQSRELTSTTMGFAAIIAIYTFSSYMFRSLQDITQEIFYGLNTPFDCQDIVTTCVRKGLFEMFLLLGPFLFCLFVAALSVNILQVGFFPNLESIYPKWGKLNILNPEIIKRFFGLQAIVRLFLGIAKIFVIAIVSYLVITKGAPAFSLLTNGTVKEIFDFLCKEVFWLSLVLTLILITLGLSDFAFQKWKFSQEMKMSKQEIKEEHKQSEGDPKLKSQIRSMVQSFIANKTSTNVPKADVIIANPIHFAIAIKYDAEKMVAPICVAKGTQKKAIAIKELAKKSKVPVVESPPLARALYKVIDVGDTIPPQFYQAVAEILAYVYRLNESMSSSDSEVFHEEPISNKNV